MLQKSKMYAYIPAKDLARAREFYEKKVGLKATQEIHGGVAYEMAGGTAAFLYLTSNAGTSKASQAYWDVDDAAAEVAELRKRGVQFEDYDIPGMKKENGLYVDDEGVKAAFFKDSEGNIMAVIESK